MTKSSKVSLQWTSHLKDKKLKEGFTEDLKYFSNTQVAKRLVAILEERINFYSNQETQGDYDSPSWSHKQAHTNGAKQELKSILDLLRILPNDQRRI